MRYLLTRVIRGYLRLKREGESVLIQEVKNEICDSILQLRLGSSTAVAESSTRLNYAFAQFFYSKVLNIYFNKSLLFSVGSNTSLIYPLPKIAQSVAESRGLKVNNFFCSFLWFCAVVFFYLRGVVALFRYNYVYLSSLFVSKKTSDQKLVMYNVNATCLSDQFEPHKKNLASWCFEHFNLPTDSPIYHDAVSQENVGRLINLRSKLGLSLGFYPRNSVRLIIFNAKVFAMLVSSLFSVLSKSGLKSMLIASKVDCMAFQASSITSDTVFCFNLSNYIFRPLWVDLAEERGCEVAFCLYSTNIEVIPLQSTNELISGWQFVSWKTIYVWDAYQADFLRRNIPFEDLVVIVVGPIPLSDSCGFVEIKSDKRLTCAVFDIQPHRLSRYAVIGYPNAYYDGKSALAFLSDLDEATARFNINRVIKRKRDAGSLVRKSYVRFVNGLIDKGWQEYPTDSSPTHLLTQVDFVVAMPFTSVALEAEFMGIPVVYYDPGGHIYNPDKVSHGVPVFDSQHSLRTWIATITH